jgi:WD40 repeat protein
MRDPMSARRPTSTILYPLILPFFAAACGAGTPETPAVTQAAAPVVTAAPPASDAGAGDAGAFPPLREGFDANGDPLPAGVVARAGTLRFRYPGSDETPALRVTADGHVLIASGEKDKIILRDAAEGREVWKIELRGAERSPIAFSSDGRLIAASGGESIRIWDAATGEPRHEVTLTEERVAGPSYRAGSATAIAFSADGARLAVEMSNGPIHLIDVSSGRLLRSISRTGSGSKAIAFSRDGRRIGAFESGEKGFSFFGQTSSDNSGIARVWDVETGRAVGVLDATGFDADSVSIALSADGSFAITAIDGVVRLLDVSTGAVLRTVDRSGVEEDEDESDGPAGASSEDQPAPIALAPDGRTFAVGGAGKVRVWAVKTGGLITTLDMQGRAAITSVAYSADGKRIAAAGADGSVGLWDAATGERAPLPEGHRGAARGIAFSPDIDRLVSTGDDGTLRLWDARTGRPGRAIELQHSNVGPVAFSPRGQVIATGHGKGVVNLWDPATGASVKTLAAARPTRVGGPPTQAYGSVEAVAFSADGSLVASQHDASFGSQSEVVLWDVASGKKTREIMGEGRSAGALAFSPDGRILAVGSDKVRLYNAATGALLETLETPDNKSWWKTTALSFSVDSRSLAVASREGPVRLWDLASASVLRTFRPPPRVSLVALSPDGKLLAAASPDSPRIHLWDTATGRPRRALEGHGGGINGLLFSQDGKLLASASADSTVLLWDTTKTSPDDRAEGSLKKSPLLDLSRIPGVKQIVMSDILAGSACGLRASGEVACWGSNSDGQLGGVAAGKEPEGPVTVKGLTDATSLASGHEFYCAVRAGGSVTCWGRNAEGELGSGAAQKKGPGARGEVRGVKDATAVGAGYGFACALTKGGSVMCWGSGPKGQLGRGDVKPDPKAAPVVGVSDASQIAVGRAHACALRRTGEVACWGENASGQLGDGTRARRSSPVAIGGLKDVEQIAAGTEHTCARLRSKAVLCWGQNDDEQLGDGTGTERARPVPVADLADAVDVRAAGDATCARTSAGALLCWGAAGTWIYDDRSSWRVSRPVAIPALAGSGRVEMSAGAVCAPSASGELACAGSSHILNLFTLYKPKSAKK